MDIRGKKVLVFGGWGLVGTAVCREILTKEPAELIVTSLHEREANEAVELLRSEASPNVTIRGEWGNIFVRHDLRGASRNDVLTDPDIRRRVYSDGLEPLSEEILSQSTLYRIIDEYRPQIVVDCVNTATGISYQNVFDATRQTLGSFEDHGALQDEVERLLCTLSIPQLIRHVQIAYEAMRRVGTEMYVKIGTSGTGGMGLNIPYTHSEEKPSRMLLSKSAVAGAHTMLLFLMGRTPDAPITKEIKPAAAIAWKGLGYGPIRRQGRTIPLYECDADGGVALGESMQLHMSPEEAGVVPMTTDGKAAVLESVYIDTGENGIFSLGEFVAITAAGQMEFVTPEEIARNVVFEILGGNTGHDIINALDNASMGPTYRAGFARANVVERLRDLEDVHGVRSVAFENLGPPRLSKLLHEVNLLQRVSGGIDGIVDEDAKGVTQRIWDEVKSDDRLRSEIISIGIPILTPNGDRLLRGPEVKIPPARGDSEVSLDSENVEAWADAGWVDLREANWARWIERFRRIDENLRASADDTSSRTITDRRFWGSEERINIGNVVAWIFMEEDQGARMKD